MRLLPDPIGPAAELYAWWVRGELRLQRCADCRAWQHPPRHRCPTCGSTATGFEPIAGTGRVFTWTVTHRPIDPAFTPPYAVVVVELDEGPRLVGNPRGLELGELRLDLPVRVALEPASETVALVVFDPA